MTNSRNELFVPIFLIILAVVNLLQGYFTEILEDESYYWVYSNFLDWGYFDHPPMTAVWIRISRFFFAGGELSVRFFSAATLSIGYFFIWKIIRRENLAYDIFDMQSNVLFVMIILSTALFGIYGFITVPDAPLMFFTTLLLYGYHKYLENKSKLSYVIISLSMTAMLYSKYHGVLIIFFILISNLKLLKDYKIWIAAIVSLLLFTPHIHWQIIHDYPSFRYHLYERTTESYRIDFTTTHLLNIIAIIGFTFPIVYLAFFKNLKNKNPFQRSLNFITAGFIFFFFLMSFRGHIQAQWIAPISIPLIIITFNYLFNHPEKQKLFRILALITIGVSIYLRLAMIFGDLLPMQFHMHGNKKWVRKVQKIIDGRKPIFVNSYQNISTFWFYTGEQPYQYNTFDNRKNQFELLKEKFECPNYEYLAQISITPDQNAIAINKRNKDSLYIKFVDNYIGINRIDYIFDKKIKENQFIEGSIPVKIKNPYERNIHLDSFETLLVLHSKDRKIIKWIDCETILKSKQSILNFGDNEANILFNIKEVESIPYSISIIGKNHPQTAFFRMSRIKILE